MDQVPDNSHNPARSPARLMADSLNSEGGFTLTDEGNPVRTEGGALLVGQKKYGADNVPVPTSEAHVQGFLDSRKPHFQAGMAYGGWTPNDAGKTALDLNNVHDRVNSPNAEQSAKMDAMSNSQEGIGEIHPDGSYANTHPLPESLWNLSEEFHPAQQVSDMGKFLNTALPLKKQGGSK